MFEITQKEVMAEGTIVRLNLKAPEIAKKIKPGQFVIIRANEKGERIPLTVADVDLTAGDITIIFQIVGKSTAMMAKYEVGEFFTDVVGPLGKPAEIENKGKVIVIGGGTGVAILHHVAKGMKEAGNHVIGIMGARNKDYLILEKEMTKISDELTICTDDGSYARKGFVTEPLKEYLEKYKNEIKEVYAIGPIIMMKTVVNIVKPYEIKTMVSLNPIMIDGTGMCGGCRVSVGGKPMFTCVDGPDFDGNLVDFDELLKRNSMYEKQEKNAACLFENN